MSSWWLFWKTILVFSSIMSVYRTLIQLDFCSFSVAQHTRSKPRTTPTVRVGRLAYPVSGPEFRTTRPHRVIATDMVPGLCRGTILALPMPRRRSVVSRMPGNWLARLTAGRPATRSGWRLRRINAIQLWECSLADRHRAWSTLRDPPRASPFSLRIFLLDRLAPLRWRDSWWTRNTEKIHRGRTYICQLDWFIDWMDCKSDCSLKDRSIDWLIDWLTDWWLD